MENLNLPPFYVGQEVVAIVDHSKGVFKKGQKFQVIEVVKDCCFWSIDIGFRDSKYAWLTCGYCNKKDDIINGVTRFNANLFAPIEERFISFAEVIAIESQLIGAN